MQNYGKAMIELMPYRTFRNRNGYDLAANRKYIRCCSHGSIWKEPNDWMMGLKQKERTLVAFWDEETGADMSSTVANIMLEANATSSSSGYLSLSYEFDNAQVAFDEREASESSVF